MKIFGCLVYACSSKRNHTKLDPRSCKCMYLGTKHGVKGNILYDINNMNIFISRDTIFFEHIFPYTHNNNDTTSISLPTHPIITCDSYYDHDSHFPPTNLPNNNPNITNHNNSHLTDNLTPFPTPAPNPYNSNHTTPTFNLDIQPEPDNPITLPRHPPNMPYGNLIECLSLIPIYKITFAPFYKVLLVHHLQLLQA